MFGIPVVTVLKILLGGVKAIQGIFDYLSDRQLIHGAQAEVVAKSLAEASRDFTDKVERANRARAGVDHSPDSVRDDPDNRDNRGT